jgi:hypothetical protein
MPAAMRQALDSELSAIEKSVGPLVERREAIFRLFAAYDDSGNQPTTRTTVKASPELNTLDMARTVIRNARRPLKVNQIEEEIKNTYGVVPAKTLYQMLYKRAKRGERFFRNDNGEFGVADMNPEVRTVLTSRDTAAA